MRQALFHGLYAVLLKTFQGTDRIGYAVALVGIGPKADVRSHCLPDQFHGKDVVFVIDTCLNLQYMVTFCFHQALGLRCHGLRTADANGDIIVHHVAVAA